VLRLLIDLSQFILEVFLPAVIGIFIFANIFIYIDIKSEMLKRAGAYSRKHIAYVFLFMFRFLLTYSIAYNFEMFPMVKIAYSMFQFDINLAWVILACIWIPEIIAVIEWAFFFSVFALAGLGAALFIDYSYLSDYEIFPYIGPFSFIMIVAILLSVRYFSNYSLNEIKNLRKLILQRIIIDIAEASFACIGGAMLWKYVINSQVYRTKFSRFLDKIESATAAFQVLTIILVSFIQFPVVPAWLQPIILVSSPIGLMSVCILLYKHRWYAWKLVFEVYTEEFSSQSLTIFQTLVEKGINERIKYKAIVIWALIGNWFTIAIALYDIFSVVYTIIPDLAIALPVLAVLALKYVSSMIRATRTILSHL